MSQNYKFKSLRYSQNQNDKEEYNSESEGISVMELGETRTIDFIQKDGTRQNFPYSHYLTAWLTKEGEERVIKIFFATHLVTINGYCLDELYDFLIQFKILSIKANDIRYLEDVEEGMPFVSNILIEWKGNVK